MDRPIHKMPVPTADLARKIEQANAEITALRLQLEEKNEEEKTVKHPYRKSLYRWIRRDLTSRIEALEKQKIAFELQLERAGKWESK
jgi:hypothetical protein